MTDLELEKVKVMGEVPAPRFGHTFTQISKTKAVLFGGATGDSGRFIMTNDTYLYDFSTRKWQQIEATGKAPSQRAAHSTVQIENMQMALFGGAASGGAGLTTDELFLLDMRTNQNSPNWIVVPVQGATPGKRYGHTMVYFKPYLIVFGGNTGTVPANDVWILNLEKAPYSWSQFNGDTESGNTPAVRVYHSAAMCTTGSASGMMVIFGGRTADQSALNDCWGLRKHRDGRWDWVQAPYKSTSEQPICRYQHHIQFLGPLMIVVGGRTNANDELSSTLEVYDTETSEWYRVNTINRYRHTIILVDSTMFIHGGFEPDFPNKPLDTMIQTDLTQLCSIYPRLGKAFGKENQNHILTQSMNRNLVPMNNNTMGNNIQNMKQSSTSIPPNTKPNSTFNNGNTLRQNFNEISVPSTSPLPAPTGTITSLNSQMPRSITPIQSCKQSQNIRLSSQAVVATTYGPEDETCGLIQRILVQKLPEESKKLAAGFQDPNLTMNSITISNENFTDIFVNALLRSPSEWRPPQLENSRFPIKKENVAQLCEQMFKLLQSHSNTLLKLRVPIKIFGSIHGRFLDLLRMFENFGAPCQDHNIGDIEKFDYLFLGNYVDRGFNSLQVLCLIFALKLKHPDQIHLLRGNHEDIRMNRIYGLGEECALRLGEDINDPNSVFQQLNRIFQILPLAAVIEEKVFCVHAGIGKNVTSVEQIDDIIRPNSPWDGYTPAVADLLWSDYTGVDGMVTDNKPRDVFSSGLVTKFGDAKLNKFVLENNLAMVIRSHEVISDGFERNPQGTLINIFSCTDYGGKLGNQGAIIKIKKNFEINPLTLPPLNQKMGIWVGPETNLQSNVAFDQEETQLKKKPLSPAKLQLR